MKKQNDIKIKDLTRFKKLQKSMQDLADAKGFNKDKKDNKLSGIDSNIKNMEIQRAQNA